MTQTIEQLKVGHRVAITQQIPQTQDPWTSCVRGTILSFSQCKTGSWYAHAKGHKLWLDRLVLKKDDGEILICNLDRYSHIEMLPCEDSEAEAEATSATD